VANIEIERIIDRTLNDIYHSLDRLDHDDIDMDMSDGKLVIEFDDGIKLIVSRQGAADQIWLAEPKGGWHYDHRDGEWIDTKRGMELMETLETLISEKLGEPVTLT
jgi:CyaY protein